VRAGDGSSAVQEYVRAADLKPEDATIGLKAGGLFLLSGRFDDAKLWAEKVLARKPRDLQAQILLASSLAGLKDLDAAVREIEEAIRLDPERGATYTNLGAFELRRGQTEAAERAFKKAVDLDPGSGVAQLALANFYWSAARWAEAEAALKKALDLEPENPFAHRVLATFYQATNRTAEAEPHLRKVFELTKAPEAALALADYYLGRKNYDAARGLLDQMATSPATALVAEIRLAALAHDLDQSQDAYTRLERVLEKDDSNLQALVAKSTFLLADRKPDEALAAATLSVEKHPDSAAAFFTLGRVQAARFQTQAAIAAYQSALRLNPRATDSKIAIARLQLAAGGNDASVTMAQDALATDPENPDARLVLIRGLLARGDLLRAEAELKPLAARFPDVSAVHVQMGRLLGNRKDEAGARKQFERALELQPDSAEAVGGLLALDLAAKRFPEARARAEAAIAARPNDPALMMLAARTAATAGDFPTAEQRLRRVIQIEPSYLAAYGSLAQILVRQGRLDEALNEFDQLASRESRPVGALTMAGMILDGQGKTAAAQERYERALQADPEAPVAANNLAWIYAQTGTKLDAALQLAKTAYGKLPNTPEVAHTLGVIYYKKDLLPEAIRTLKTIVDANPTTPVYRFHLGMAYAKAGESAEAAQQLTRALTLKSDFDGAQEARATLATLRGAQPTSD
jgi:tetratricopeptide (TPR) repeat protein